MSECITLLASRLVPIFDASDVSPKNLAVMPLKLHASLQAIDASTHPKTRVDERFNPSSSVHSTNHHREPRLSYASRHHLHPHHRASASARHWPWYRLEEDHCHHDL